MGVFENKVRGSDARSARFGGLVKALAPVAVLACFLLGAHVAGASSSVVSTLADGGAGSLPAAIDAANVGGGAITFNVDGTIVLTSVLPTINAAVSIDGSGHAITISGNNQFQVLTVNSGKSLDLRSITIANGSASFGGGGIFVDSGATLTVTSSTFFSNAATFVAGAIDNQGTSPVISSTFSGNTSNFFAGGIYNTSRLNVVDSTFLNNASINNGGAIYNQGTLVVTNSTLYNNSSSGNTSQGAGIINAGNGVARVINSTLYGNAAGAVGGGIRNISILTLTNTIIANNISGGDCSNDLVAGGTVTGSHTLISDTYQTCGLTNGANGNVIGVDPELGPLANHGGPALTMAPLPGSPAINAGTDAGAPAFDQRGVSRPQGGLYDIGAVESLSWPRAYLPVVQR